MAEQQGPPSISLPKGGGAIRGLGEKFAANPVTGTGSLTVPLPLSPGRGGAAPQLTLSYDTGSGNGPFGVGWALSLPAITRKTDKGLPRYLDGDESDVFVLSGAEDLVPGAEHRRTVEVDGVAQSYVVRRYRPRIEGLFARIERWTRSDGDVHWRSISRDNLLSIYGADIRSRIADPQRPEHVFSWLICETRDDKGNAVGYEYKAEDGMGVDLSRPHERHRGEPGDPRRGANRYPKRVRYGNRVPLLDESGGRPEQPAGTFEAMFEVVFDYGEHDPHMPGPSEDAPWPQRPDPFSNYRAGFEVRTNRLCRRALMFHHFPDEAGVGADCLVRATEFDHSAQPNGYSMLVAVRQTGFRRDPAGGYVSKSMPPLEFTYTAPETHDHVTEVDPESLRNLPAGLDGDTYRWVDLHGDGLPGILTHQGGSWFYKRNLSPLTGLSARFGPAEPVALMPSLADRGEFLDLAGDGTPDLVVLSGATPGFYEHDAGYGWKPFRPFPSRVNRNLDDAAVRIVDLDGDGLADILADEDTAFEWYPSLGEQGFGPARRTPKGGDEEQGPRLALAEASESIHLADLTGDGLSDLVRIRNDEVCYWPNLGYGRFGAKVVMDDAPRFGSACDFDPARIRLADIDGSGTTDIVYLHRDGIRLYFNQSGNGWSPARTLRSLPPVDDLTRVAAVDLLGNGTACLVWSTTLPADARTPMRYIDLMGGQKPHLLVRIDNNLGAESLVSYAASTAFCLADARAGRPWPTRLPFPVHVVERVEAVDHIGRTRFVTRFAYHDGYFDGVEREFRGFGMVERIDTEEFGTIGTDVPPVLTKTWTHTGAMVNLSNSSGYYRESGLGDEESGVRLLPDTILPDGLTLAERREAARALKGLMLRQEVYGLDRTAKAETPYSVTEQNFTVAMLQPRAANRHAVFHTHPRESLVFHYERDAADPRIQHTMTLRCDDYGNVLATAAIGYGRRTDAPGLALLDAPDAAQQTGTICTYTENDVTNLVDSQDYYRTPLTSESRSYEISGVHPAGGTRFRHDEWASGALVASAAEIAYESTADPATPQKRLLERVRTVYRSDDLAILLPAGTLQALALPGEQYRLALTPGLVAQFLAPKFGELGIGPADVLGAAGGAGAGYVDLDGDGHWWVPSGRVYFSPAAGEPAPSELARARAHFFLPRRYRDPFHTAAAATETVVDYDAYDLLIAETRDALGARVTAGQRLASGATDRPGNDYRLLGPVLVTDPNRNRSAVTYDALGLVAGTAVMGKAEDTQGDTLTGLRIDLGADDIDAFHDADDPHVLAATLLDGASTRFVYDLDRFRRSRQQWPTDPDRWLPPLAATIVRETHRGEPVPPGGARVQIDVTFSDGFGREIQRKTQAEPGAAGPRWVGSGWTVFNNKAKPVRQYEPFFSGTHRFEFGAVVGVSRLLYYDPLGRVVAVLHPNQVWEKAIVGPWRTENWDVNDTVAIPDPATDPDVGDFFRRLPDAEYRPGWLAARANGALGQQEQAAAAKAAAHAGTPDVSYADTLGRVFLTVAHNTFERGGVLVEERYASRVELDVKGNARAVRDAMADGAGRVVTRYDLDVLGQRIHQSGMEAGERWLLNDVTGKPLYGWDSRGHCARTAYDPLRRTADSFLRAGAGPEILLARSVYGDTRTDPEPDNLRGKVVELYDQTGVLVTERCDFKGNVLRNRRTLARDYKSTLDWAGAVELEDESFVAAMSYDALNRPVQMTPPHSDRPGSRVTVIAPVYNEAKLLGQLHAWLDLDSEPAGPLDPAGATLHAITAAGYNAKGQRESVGYGNGVTTAYSYDPMTFRLTRAVTTRDADSATLQDLAYTYDPVGNITHIADAAQQAVFFRNQRVTPSSDYTYDAVYRLIGATGREHLGQAGGSPVPFTADDAARRGLPQPGDGSAMSGYLERYFYDAAGNFTAVTHTSTDPAAPGWTATFGYDEPSMVEPASRSNRLTSVTTGGVTETHTYDAHGNTTSMPHLTVMAWDHRDQLRATSRQGVSTGTPETTYYVYDAAGLRARKVTERQNGTRRQERIYLGGFELYRRYDGQGATVELERQTLELMDDTKRVALVETRTVGADPAPEQLVRFQYGDHVGSACLELDGQAQIISYEEYSPFGSTTYQAVRSQTETPKRYRYAGRERDEESGLNYHGARYYAPWRGRWLNCDPLGVRGGINLYVFARNNPVQFVDPGGKQPDPWAQGQTQTLDPGDQGTDVSNPHPETTFENSAWHYTDENWNRWVYVPWEEWQWTQRWARLEGSDSYVLIGEWTKVPTGTWFPLTTEVIQVSGSAPKEEKSPWYKRAAWGVVKLGLELWSPTGKAKWVKWGLQIGMEWYESDGSLFDAFTSFTIQGVKNKAMSKAADLVGGVIFKVLGSEKIPKGTNLALGMDSQGLDAFARQTQAITAMTAYDRKYVVFGIAEDDFMGVFDGIAAEFIANGGRLKFNLTGLDPNFAGAGRATARELGRIVRNPAFESATDFFENGVQITDPATLTQRLAPFRGKAGEKL